MTHHQRISIGHGTRLCAASPTLASRSPRSTSWKSNFSSFSIGILGFDQRISITTSIPSWLPSASTSSCKNSPACNASGRRRCLLNSSINNNSSNNSNLYSTHLMRSMSIPGHMPGLTQHQPHHHVLFRGLHHCRLQAAAARQARLQIRKVWTITNPRRSYVYTVLRPNTAQCSCTSKHRNRSRKHLSCTGSNLTRKTSLRRRPEPVQPVATSSRGYSMVGNSVLLTKPRSFHLYH